MPRDERDNFDNRDLELPADLPAELPAELVDDLRSLYQPRLFVPPTMDERIRAEAQRRLGALQPRRRGRRAWWLSGAAGMAAAITLAVVLHVATQQQQPDATVAPSIALQPGDVDRSGRVDILDAFALARQIEAHADVAAWDINGDGVVDQRDVDAIARQAVTIDAATIGGGQS